LCSRNDDALIHTTKEGDPDWGHRASSKKSFNLSNCISFWGRCPNSGNRFAKVSGGAAWGTRPSDIANAWIFFGRAGSGLLDFRTAERAIASAMVRLRWSGSRIRNLGMSFSLPLSHPIRLVATHLRNRPVLARRLNCLSIDGPSRSTNGRNPPLV